MNERRHNLLVAIQQGKISQVRLLLAQGVEINFVDEMGTPLHYAAQAGNLDVVKSLVEAGAGVNARNKDGYTALHCACNSGSFGVVKYLAEQKATIDCQSDTGITPLHEAITGKFLEIVSFLIFCGANTNLRSTSRPYFSPLHFACVCRSEKVAKILIKNGASINYEATDGPPLVYAIMANQQEIVRLLLENKADPNVKYQNILPCLHLAVTSSSGSIEIPSLLISYSADVNSTDKFGRTPLQLALQSRKQQIADLLIANGAKTANR